MIRKTYIENNDDKTALSGFLQEIGTMQTGIDFVSPLESFGRITAEAIFAKKCDPVYNAAAMDGIAVVAENTIQASEKTPLTLKLNQDFVYVNTGEALTGKFDSVIMIEDVIQGTTLDEVSIISPSYPWQHVRVVGESIVEGEMVLPSFHSIRATDIGALVASGQKTVPVIRKPKVGIIPTGNEMTEDPDDLREGKLIESNSKVFSALTTQYGGTPNRYNICEDKLESLCDAISKAIEENDIVIVNAGSSAGTKDYTVKAISRLGTLYLHGIAIKPGKPTILGIIKGKPIIGIPGYPVSAYLVFDMFVRPIIKAFLHQNDNSDITVSATLTKRITSSTKHAELIRMALGEVSDKMVATPLERGAAAIMSMVRADGLYKVDRLKEFVEAGTNIEVRLIKPLAEIKKALVVIGSHDLIIDVLANKMPMSSAHVGSMGGVFAMMRGECHIAPIHLLDTNGQYNISFVKQYFKSQKMALIKVVGRTQGLAVLKGNPKNILGIQDFAERKLKFANRQRGAGTRLLFDYKLQEYNLNSSQIFGYEKEYNTHLSVATAIKNGIADTGLTILSAAKAMDLDFIPIANEEYDFLIPYAHLNDDRIQTLISFLKSDEFKENLKQLGGYDDSHIGETVIIE